MSSSSSMRCKRATYPEPMVMAEESVHDSESLSPISSEGEQLGHPENAYVPPGEVIAAINEDNRRREQRDLAKRDQIRKRQRESAARENREVAQDADFSAEQENDADSEDTNPAKRSTARRRGAKKSDEEEEEIDFHKEFIKIGFTNPIYPHPETLEKLGIKEDVEMFLRGCGIKEFATTVYPAYPKAAAEFLATLKVQDFRDSAALFDRFGGGLITFNFEGQQKSLDFKEINEVFGFSPGEPKQHVISKEDLNMTWYLMTKEKVLPAKPMATAIRHPAINYARKVIAKTFFCRYDSGNITTCDMQFLTIAFEKEFGFREPWKITGDQAGAGLAYVLCKFLENIKGKVSACIKKKHKYEELSVGGIITGLLVKAKVPLDGAEQIPPKFMDIDYLYTQQMLTGLREENRFYYKFNQKGGQIGIVALPNDSITNLDNTDNIRFVPPQSFLIKPSSLGISRTPAPAKRPEPTSQKKRAAPSEPAKPCICTTDGFRDKLVAELTKDITRSVEANVWDLMQVEVDRKIKEGIEKGLAELSKTFVKRPARQPESSTRREPERDRRPAETNPAPARRLDRASGSSAHNTPAAAPRPKPGVRLNSQRPLPPPPRRT